MQQINNQIKFITSCNLELPPPTYNIQRNFSISFLYNKKTVNFYGLKIN